jgi:hypothetical protein
MTIARAPAPVVVLVPVASGPGDRRIGNKSVHGLGKRRAPPPWKQQAIPAPPGEELRRQVRELLRQTEPVRQEMLKAQ